MANGISGEMWSTLQRCLLVENRFAAVTKHARMSFSRVLFVGLKPLGHELPPWVVVKGFDHQPEAVNFCAGRSRIYKEYLAQYVQYTHFMSNWQ